MSAGYFWGGWLVLIVLLAVFGYLLNVRTDERDAARTEIRRILSEDASCAMTNNGPRVICALRAGRLQYTALKDSEVICSLESKNHATCILGDGTKINLRRR